MPRQPRPPKPVPTKKQALDQLKIVWRSERDDRLRAAGIESSDIEPSDGASSFPNADHCRAKARQNRERAMREPDPARRKALLSIADEYDRLADAIAGLPD